VARDSGTRILVPAICRREGLKALLKGEPGLTRSARSSVASIRRVEAGRGTHQAGSEYLLQLRGGRQGERRDATTGACSRTQFRNYYEKALPELRRHGRGAIAAPRDAPRQNVRLHARLRWPSAGATGRAKLGRHGPLQRGTARPRETSRATKRGGPDDIPSNRSRRAQSARRQGHSRRKTDLRVRKTRRVLAPGPTHDGSSTGRFCKQPERGDIRCGGPSNEAAHSSSSIRKKVEEGISLADNAGMDFQMAKDRSRGNNVDGTSIAGRARSLVHRDARSGGLRPPNLFGNFTAARVGLILVAQMGR